MPATRSPHAADVAVTPAGNLAANDVQEALQELQASIDGIDVTVTAADITDSTAAGRAVLTAADAAAQRSALGLGTAATQNTGAFEAAGVVAAHEADTTSVHGIANTANLYVAGGADVAVADGGTGASTAAAARTNLGAAPIGDFHLYLMTVAR